VAIGAEGCASILSQSFNISRAKADHMTDVGGITAEQLRGYIERVERLEAEKAEVAATIKDVMAEAKGNGFDTKVIRQVIKLRKMDAEDRAEQESLLDLYLRALGMAPDFESDEPPA
jgi:uncharacterized protein (UPF0335 family)